MRALGPRRVKDRPPAGRPAARLRRVLETPRPQGKLAAMELRLGRRSEDFSIAGGRSLGTGTPVPNPRPPNSWGCGVRYRVPVSPRTRRLPRATSQAEATRRFATIRPTKKGGTDDKGSNNRPAFVGLGHELGHAEAMADGRQSFDKQLGGDGAPKFPGSTPPSETNSGLMRENQIRAEQGLPPRSDYYPK